MRVTIFTAMFVLPLTAAAFGDMKGIEGKTVIAAGAVESLDCPLYGKYNCNTWPVGLLRFQFKNICFTTSSPRCSVGCKAMLAIGDDKSPKLYTVSTIGDDLDESRVELFKCPDVM